jgi:DNA mismatch endonuclease (patch repair protein)
LPGSPDLVFPRRKKVIFVHGCFWHSHTGCRKGKAPKSNVEYWKPKLAANKKRDKKHQRFLESAGWEVLVLWQCELSKESLLKSRLSSFLEK